MPRIVLVTNDSLNGQRILAAVNRRGVTPDAVLYVVGGFGIPERRGVGLLGRLLRWPTWAARAARRRWRFRREREAVYAARCTRVVPTGFMNSRRLLRDLRALAPDWIVLGGGGILGQEVIDTARVGVLNAHPALLPWVRGCGIVGASLAHGVALGATVHLVDRGIDTGPPVERRLLAARPEDTDLDALEVACDELAAEMMADVVEGIARGGAVPAGAPQTVRYPLFRWEDAEGRRHHGALAAAGRAHALYEAWRPLCTDARGTLPARFEPPATMTLEPVAPRASL